MPAAWGHQLHTVPSCQGKISFPVLQEWSCVHRAVQSFPIPPYPDWFIWWWQKKFSSESCQAGARSHSWGMQQDQHTWEEMGTPAPANLRSS